MTEPRSVQVDNPEKGTGRRREERSISGELGGVDLRSRNGRGGGQEGDRGVESQEGSMHRRKVAEGRWRGRASDARFRVALSTSRVEIDF